MDRNSLLAVTLLILVLPAVAADPFGAGLRFLMSEGKGDGKSGTQKFSPPPTPLPSPKIDPLVSNQKPPPPPPVVAQSPPPPNPGPSLESDKSNNTTQKISPELGNSPSAPPPPSPASKDPPVPKSGDHGKEGKDPEGNQNLTGPGNPTKPIQEAWCSARLEKCQNADLVACLQHPGDDSKESFLLVQNEGNDALTVNITVPTSMHIDSMPLHLDSAQKRNISWSGTAANGTKIILNAGKGDCVIHIRPSIEDWDPFQQFQAYASLVTPLYGAYFMFLTVFIGGGTWACCKFGRRGRRGDSEVPYQQLEMGAQQSCPDVDATSTVNGWDHGWDDDWDEEVAVVRPSEKHPVTSSVSSNGLTARSPNKDGWDNDWDD